MVAPQDNGVYRPSASLILAAKEDSSAKFDYSLLLIKRSERTSYALNHCVFPGGVFDAGADESTEWLEYFRSFGVTDEDLKRLSCDQVSVRADFLSSGQNFSRDISLRLTALREAFEEVGLLLCANEEGIRSWHATTEGEPRTLLLQPDDRSQWQQRVHDDATQFLALCKHLHVLPNLWCLLEWSAWRTAATASRKYDTIYYVTALKEQSKQVSLLLEPQEVASAYWLDPEAAWTQSQNGTIWLPFMLLYDTARLMNLRRWEDLLKFSRQRSALGTTLVQPVYYRCDGCMFGVLPGDELYVDQPEKCTQSIMLNVSVAELNSSSRQYNRYIVYDFHKVVLASNVPPFNGHLQLQERVNSQLAKL
ncbi:nucleoside diphosphate-linked moiety X motif 19 [Drosophila subobscura]|uniref:nucleoside diphosphate-linked moiety X motif 19 n=1 Tax=Drosophila subobscura TaxID=7241 RepID=UPI00155A5460|nr:nucleoside diphosphate-linked moiety X motif 19 [Drosophila subobscura]